MAIGDPVGNRIGSTGALVSNILTGDNPDFQPINLTSRIQENGRPLVDLNPDPGVEIINGYTQGTPTNGTPGKPQQVDPYGKPVANAADIQDDWIVSKPGGRTMSVGDLRKAVAGKTNEEIFDYINSTGIRAEAFDAIMGYDTGDTRKWIIDNKDQISSDIPGDRGVSPWDWVKFRLGAPGEFEDPSNISIRYEADRRAALTPEERKAEDVAKAPGAQPGYRSPGQLFSGGSGRPPIPASSSNNRYLTSGGGGGGNRGSSGASSSTVRSGSTNAATSSEVDETNTPERAARALDLAIREGASPLQTEQQTRISGLMQEIANQAQSFTPEQARIDAQGEVDALTRQLMERILPEVSGAFEASGASNSALEALMQQDLASRTAGLQSRAITDKQIAYGNQSVQLGQLFQRATATEDPVAQNLMDLLSIARGTVNQGTRTGTDNRAENSVSDVYTSEPSIPEPTANELLLEELRIESARLNNEGLGVDIENARNPPPPSAGQYGGGSGGSGGGSNKPLGSQGSSYTQDEAIALFNSQSNYPYGYRPSSAVEPLSNYVNADPWLVQDQALAQSLGL